MGLEEFNQPDEDDLLRSAESFKEIDDEVEVMYDELVAESDDAIKFKFGNDMHWIPKSQMRTGDGKSIFIPSWMAFEKELN